MMSPTMTPSKMTGTVSNYQAVGEVHLDALHDIAGDDTKHGDKHNV